MLLVDCSAFISDCCINKEELILRNFLKGFSISVITASNIKKILAISVKSWFPRKLAEMYVFKKTPTQTNKQNLEI